MKIRKVMAVLVLAATCANASAQNGTTAPKKYVDMSEWQSCYFQYSSLKLNMSNNDDDLGLDAITLGYSKAISIDPKSPIFVEAGVAGQIAFHTEDDTDNDWGPVYRDDECKYTLLSLKVPVNIIYKWSVSENVNILPYAGLVAKYHLYGKLNYDHDGKDEDLDLFDKKDMEHKDNTWNRFQLGYQIGVNIMFSSKWHLGVSYGKDFSEVIKKGKFSTTSVTLGFGF